MNKEQKSYRYTIWLLLFAAIVVLSLPVILNRPAIFGFKSFDFTESGQIGDTIGGITAPFVNLIAAVLIFLSFKEQTKANKYFLRSTSAEKEHNLVFHLIENLDSRISAFEYRIITNHPDRQKTTNVYSGIAGIQRYTNDRHKDDARVAKGEARFFSGHSQDTPYTAGYYSDIYQIVRLLSFIASKISDADFRVDSTEKDEIQISLFERLDITYSTSLEHSINTFIEAFDKAKYDHISFKEVKNLHQKYNAIKADILLTS